MILSLSGQIDNELGQQPMSLRLERSGAPVTLAMTAAGGKVDIPITALAIDDRVYCNFGNGQGLAQFTGTCQNEEPGDLILLFRAGNGEGQREVARAQKGATVQFSFQLRRTHDDLLVIRAQA